MKSEDQEYFNFEKTKENPIFLQRFSNVVFKDLKVLDLGCGHGALSIDIAQNGAARVVGIDIDKHRIDFAMNNLTCNYKELVSKVKFINTDLANHKENDYDIIISKDSFEHIISLDLLMADIRKKLRTGGRLITGFGPLYNSPWGDHKRLKVRIPWMHAILPKSFLVNRFNKKYNRSINSIYELGLNGLSLKEYNDIFYHAEGFKVIDFRMNVSYKVFGKIFNLISYIPGLKEYFTFNLYCILERVV